MRKFSVTLLNGDEFTLHQTTNTFDGNPRYIVHFLDLADTYEKALAKAKPFGGKRYRAKHYGGGIVFSTYTLETTLSRMMGITD